MRASSSPGSRAASPRRPVGPDGVVVAASGFTSLWALSWLSAEAVAANTAVAGGFAVGGVMAGSGLTLLWWRTRTMRALRTEGEREEERAAEDAGTPHP